MAIPAIHPGEHLAEELKELDMSEIRGTRPADPSSNQPHNRNPQSPAGNHRRHSLTLGSLLRHQPGVLAELAEALRVAPRRAESRPRNRRAPNPP